ncbi:hypothetical protein K456DRAFT_1914802 [Colletotrichum gloeosporioides 23]|nr:hypothetical protein K456DRAFT_1914802 [Colletotrichum gloeosporioides 23]
MHEDNQTPSLAPPAVYPALPLTISDIRLVTIDPRDENDEDRVVCRMSVVNLGRCAPEFHTLSYTWGPASPEDAAKGVTDNPSNPVWIVWETGKPSERISHGEVGFVASNLKAALLRLRDNSDLSGKRFWIDAICIDQRNLQERSSQVRLMARVFRSATSVLIWLGEEDEHTAKSFHLMESVAEAKPEMLHLLTPHLVMQHQTCVDENTNSTQIPPLHNHTYWEAARKLFRRNYFSRVWIIQEVVLAKKATVLCGSHMTSWEHLESFSHFVTTTSWSRHFANLSSEDSIPGPCYHMTPTGLKANRKSRQALSYAETLVHALIRSRPYRCRDSRDKVYGLLGLVDFGDLFKDKRRLHPVYGGRSVESVYIDAAIQILEDSDDLLLLYDIEGQKFQYSDLPSWVPDWRCEKPLGLRVTGYRRFRAAGDLPRNLFIHDSSKILEIRGLKLDDIETSAETKHDIISSRPFPGVINILRQQHRHQGKVGLEAVWRALLTDTDGDPPQCPVDTSFEISFLHWLGVKLASFRGLTGSIGEGNELLASLGLAETPQQGKAAAYEASFSHGVHLRLFSTSQKHIGVGSESLEERDSVWIVPGSRVPLIFRSVGDCEYRLVGGAYVHGFMNGEALGVDAEGLQWQTLRVV